MKVTQESGQLSLDYGFDNNGRGASSQEKINFSETGFPINWSITGKTTFGNAVDEQFMLENGTASWRSAAGEGTHESADGIMYIAQNASPYASYLYVNALLNSKEATLPALPAGTLRVRDVAEYTFTNEQQTIPARIVALGGIALDPTYLALSPENQLMAILSPRFTLLKEGFEDADTALRDIATDLNALRFKKIAQKVTHTFEKPVRINNVRLFDPEALALTKLKSVVVEGQRIVEVSEPVSQPQENEVLVDGAGGHLGTWTV